MPIPHKQIKNFMNSKMYQDNKHPLHKDANDFVNRWFQKNANKLDDNNDFKENISPQTTPAKTFVSDDDLIKRNIPEIKHHEGVKDFPYKDTKGIITVGGGLNVDNFDTYAGLKWVHKATNRPATPDEIKADYDSIKNAPSGNYRADSYGKYTTLRLSDEEIDNQIQSHLKNDLKQVRRTVPEFDNLPIPLQDVIIDIQYNTGHIEKFPKFLEAICDKNIRKMVEESHRKGVSEQRNWDMAKKILLGWD